MVFGSGIGNELRDPCIFVEDNKKYLLYTVAGEAGIAITKLAFPKLSFCLIIILPQ